MIIVTHRETEHVRSWKLATLACALVGVAAAFWGHSQARRVDALQLQADESRTELAAAREEVRQAAKRDLPISVSYSVTASPANLVAVLKSDFPRSLEIVALCTSVRSTQHKRFNLVIPPRGQIQIGQAEGWSVEPGSRITLYNGAFRPAEYIVPEL